MAKKRDESEVPEIKITNSRKRYIPLYFLVLVLGGFVLYLYFNGRPLNKYALWAAIVFIVLAIKYTELHRIYQNYAISSHYLIHTKGFFNKSSRKIFVANISDVVLKKNVLQRMLDYGTLEVHSFSEGKPLVSITDINHPQNFLNILKKKMDWIEPAISPPKQK